MFGRMTHYACRICKSNKRSEIEKLLKDKAVVREISNKYLPFFDCDLHLLEQSIANHRKHIPKELTKNDEELLERFDKGEVELDEMSRIVAVRVFKRILENPDQVKFIDFFRAELLKMKQEQAKNSDSAAMEAWKRLCGGFLPLNTCPKCNHSLLPEDNKSTEVDESNTFLN